MIRRTWALCVLLSLVFAAGAQAQATSALAIAGPESPGNDHRAARGRVLGTLIRRSQQVYNREGTVPALTGLIDGVEAARDAPADDGGGRMAIVLVTGAALVAGSALALFALRRARRL